MLVADAKHVDCSLAAAVEPIMARSVVPKGGTVLLAIITSFDLEKLGLGFHSAAFDDNTCA